MDNPNLLMKRAHELAQLGLGNVSPNPMVGCVIFKDGRIIGEGYHRMYGQAHAEVNAIKTIADPSLLNGAQIIVNLEPCAHQGKTPPCADLLIHYQVGDVFISNIDPNPRVNGNGIKKLNDAGIKVHTGLLEKEGADLNRRYFTSYKKNRPYIILKWAQTKDGFMARENFDSKWISDEYSRKIVHKWRYEEDAILVGSNTAYYDNPGLDVRDWPINGPTQNLQFNPVRIVIDKDLKLDEGLTLFSGVQKTLRINQIKEEVNGNCVYVKVHFDEHFLDNLNLALTGHQLQSVIVEGGAFTLNQFIQSGLWDEARIFKSPKTFESGIKAPQLKGAVFSENKLVADTLTIIKNEDPNG